MSKQYIKKFTSPSAADDYEIVDIPFTTTIAGETRQNLVCNTEGKKLVNNSGTIEITDAGSALVNFTVIFCCGNNYGSTWLEPQIATYNEQAEPDMTIAQFIDSAYNPLDNTYNTTKRYQHKYSISRGSACYFTTNSGQWDYYYSGNTLPEDHVITDGETLYYYYISYCLLGDTEVTMSDGSIKQIKDIEVGDEVLSLDLTTGEKVSRKVIFTDAAENKSTTVWDEWKFLDGTIIKTAHRHEFYNIEAGRFKYMDEWQIGEHAYREDGTAIELVEHVVHKEVVNHYKITLEDSNNFFANGLLTGDRYCNELNINLK